MFQFPMIFGIHSREITYSLDSNGSVSSYLQLDIIYGTAVMKSTTYMASFSCYSHGSQQTHLGLHTTRLAVVDIQFETAPYRLS